MECIDTATYKRTTKVPHCVLQTESDVCCTVNGVIAAPLSDGHGRTWARVDNPALERREAACKRIPGMQKWCVHTKRWFALVYLSVELLCVHFCTCSACCRLEGEKSASAMLGSPVAHPVAGRPAASPSTPTASTVSFFEYRHPRRKRRRNLCAMAGSNMAGRRTALSMRAPICGRNNHLQRQQCTRVHQFAPRNTRQITSS